MPEKPKPRGSLTGAGVALVVIGLLILVPSGLCTGLLGVLGLMEGFTMGNWSNLLNSSVALIIPVIFVAIGAALLRSGLRMRK